MKNDFFLGFLIGLTATAITMLLLNSAFKPVSRVFDQGVSIGAQLMAACVNNCETNVSLRQLINSARLIRDNKVPKE